MIVLQGVGFAYGRVSVLEDVSGSVEPGQAIALVGENGAGKTTLTRLIMGLEQPDTGTVRVMGEVPTDPARVARSVAYVFQHPARQLFARSVLEEITFGARQLGHDPARVASMARANLERVNLTDRAGTHPHDLPPGEQKLIALAAALTQDPEFLILDEPTQGLDREAAHTVAAIVRDHVEGGGGVLAVTHDSSFVLETADRVWHLADGRIDAEERPEVIFDGGRSAADIGLTVPPVAQLANRMGWSHEDRRAGPAARQVNRIVRSN